MFVSPRRPENHASSPEDSDPPRLDVDTGCHRATTPQPLVEAMDQETPAMTDTTQPSPSTSLFDWPIDVPVHEAVFEALGLASLCWEPRPTGVFDSTLAGRVGDELMDLLRRKLWTDEPAAGRSVSGGETP